MVWPLIKERWVDIHFNYNREPETDVYPEECTEREIITATGKKILVQQISKIEFSK